MSGITLSDRKKRQINKAASKIRRRRGYQWEDTIVKRFKSVKSWRAFRLGSPSTKLPDVLAVNTELKTLLAIEAKSGTVMSLPVPAEQIDRCIFWANTFEIYNKRSVILAFKFLRKKRVGRAKYEKRELREFFKVWDIQQTGTDCYCTYDGKIFTKVNGRKIELKLQEYKMPF